MESNLTWLLNKVKKMNKNKTAEEALNNNNVGPIMRAGELAPAVAEAAAIDNVDKIITVEDKIAYVRIYTESELVLYRKTIEEELGRPFNMNELEVNLASFAGRIEMSSEKARFYYVSSL